MNIVKDQCPICNNKDQEKIVLDKDREFVRIYKCSNCGFRWGIPKDNK